ncbi:MAG TPA: hypothetical protein VMV29_20995 [Ktedonobacterales bacterium]|nr:hypothetical protein [Ktedonobacterales bacterium]
MRYSQQRSADERHAGRQLAHVATATLVALALGALLAACGGAGAAGTPGGSGTAVAGATKTTLTPSATATDDTTTATPGAASGAANAACPAAALNAAAPNPTRVVTPADRTKTIAVQVSAVIEVRLPASIDRWSFDGKGAPTLTLQRVQGNYVASLHACVWDFTAAQAGTVTLGYVGQPNCAARQPCPTNAMLLPLTVSVA